MTGVLALAAVIAAVIGSIAWVRLRYLVVTVHGPSMEPTLYTGDRVLARRAALGRVGVGDIVVLRPPEDRSGGIIKRVVAVPGDPVPRASVPALARVPESTVPPGKVVIVGDGTQSSDSRQYGYFEGTHIIGVMLRRLAPGR